jgi:predicted RNase H-like HicB family nuclease
MMKTASFIAIIEPAKEGFGVYFPDLPGCTSAGATQDDAARNASDALALHLDGMAQDNTPIPASTPWDDIDVPKGSRALLVRVGMPGKLERINITMDEGTLAAADRLAEEKGLSRSGYFAELVRIDLASSAGYVPSRGRRAAPEDPHNPRLALGVARLKGGKSVPRSLSGGARKLAGRGRRLKAD